MTTPVMPFTSEQITMLIESAGRAPSIHNTQPWRFVVREGAIDVLLDRARALPVADPAGREAVISCGAATYNLRLAMAHLGIEPAVELRPDPADPDHLARVRRGGTRRPTGEERQQYAAIGQRRSHRRVFLPQPVAPAAVAGWRRAAEAEQAWLHVLSHPAERRQVADLAWQAATRLAADQAYRAELDRWTGHHESRDDGVPAGSLGTAPYPVDGLPRQALGTSGPRPPTLDEEFAHGTVIVIGTSSDDPRDWMRAGQALQRVLLTATAAGMVASFANQVTEIALLRGRLAGVLRRAGFPQLLLRLGYPLVDVPVTPRRPVADLLTHEI